MAGRSESGSGTGSSVGTRQVSSSEVQACPWAAHAWITLAMSVNTSRLGLCSGPREGREVCRESGGSGTLTEAMPSATSTLVSGCLLARHQLGLPGLPFPGACLDHLAQTSPPSTVVPEAFTLWAQGADITHALPSPSKGGLTLHPQPQHRGWPGSAQETAVTWLAVSRAGWAFSDHLLNIPRGSMSWSRGCSTGGKTRGASGLLAWTLFCPW